ncbi:MAG: MarR family transcriptional regulator [Desulfobulbaceae bacterium]|nr:MarR family transcriptional regulator [Desulfobulbaceae bacterium]
MRHYKNSPEHLLALNTFIKLVRCTNSVTADIHKNLPSGLTVSQFGILEALFHLGPMPQKELAQKILKSAGNITTVINNLEKASLVSRTTNDQDRRFYNISLTPKGKRLIQDIFPAHADVILERLSKLTEDEQEILGKLLGKLSSHK